MSKLEWDKTGEREFETGVDHGVLYPSVSGTYPKGVAWNGLTSVSENPTGAEPNKLYADNINYVTMMSAEEMEGTIEAYMWPAEWNKCDGSDELAEGVFIGQQNRQTFGLAYRTVKGNDTELNDHGYKLHLIYGALASPSEKSYETINDSPDAITFSWEFTCTPVNVTDKKPTAVVTIDSTKVDKDKLKALEDILYGTETNEPRLPLPDEIKTLFASTTSGGSGSSTGPSTP